MKDSFFQKLSLARLRAQLPLISRILAASLGGYVLASLFSVATLVFPISGPEAVLWGAQLSFLVWSAAFIGVFLARSATRAWVGLALCGLLCLAAILGHQWMEGRL